MILAIVQARMGSTRLPSKVMKAVCGKPLIEILFLRLSHSKKIDKIILATPESSENDPLAVNNKDGKREYDNKGYFDDPNEGIGSQTKRFSKGGDHGLEYPHNIIEPIAKEKIKTSFYSESSD